MSIGLHHGLARRPVPPSSGKYKPLAALTHIIASCELLRISQQQGNHKMIQPT
jgi:hypothetical protein